MIKLPTFNVAFQTFLEGTSQLSRSLDIIRGAFANAASMDDLPTHDSIRAALSVYSLVATGHNGVGPVSLPPTTDPITGRVTRRVLPGARLVFAYDPVTFGGIDRSPLFEQTVTVADQLQQNSAANLSTFNMLFFLLT